MKLLIVDDDRTVRTTVSVGLQARWREAVIYAAADGEAGLKMFLEYTPDLVILDLHMPRRNGLEVLREIRKHSEETPVLMLTQENDNLIKVTGLETGADDYLTKPFSPAELSARVKRLLQRSGNPAPEDREPTFKFGDLFVDFTTHGVSVDGVRISLTPTEYRLLYELVTNAGRVLPFSDLLTKVWGAGYEDDLNALKIYVSRLRKKLGDDSRRPRYVLTERNVGYKFPAPGAISV